MDKRPGCLGPGAGHCGSPDGAIWVAHSRDVQMATPPTDGLATPRFTPPKVPRHTPIEGSGLSTAANGPSTPLNLRTPADLGLSKGPTPISSCSASVGHPPTAPFHNPILYCHPLFRPAWVCGRFSLRGCGFHIHTDSIHPSRGIADTSGLCKA